VIRRQKMDREKVIVTKSKRLLFRSLKKKDINFLMTVWGDQETMKYAGGKGDLNKEQASLDYYIALEQKKGYAPYLLLEKSTMQPIGVCGFQPSKLEVDADLFYHLHKDAWGKGYASEAGHACLEYGTKSLGLTKIGASVEQENQASIRVLEKLGFVYLKRDKTILYYVYEYRN